MLPEAAVRFLACHDLAPGDLADKVEKVRAAIERDDFRSPDVKKLGLGGFYRAKLDDAARLLLMFAEHRGEKACLALEVIRGHAYDRSRFLRGAPVDETKLEDAGPPQAAEARPLRYLHPTRSVFHHLDKPLTFDDLQDAALRHRPPLVLVGSAGSGKTALLLQRLRQMPGRVAYVTESKWLAETSRALYVAFDGAPEDQEADFLSYRQLIETVGVPEGRPVTFRDFAGFFERHRQKIRFADAHQAFEELRGVLTAEPEGPLSREAYLGLGVRQSMFDGEQRAALFDLFERYRAWLAAERFYEPNLVAHAWLARMEPVYDFVAVDEVQDLTNVQLSLVLRSLKTPGQFVIAGDANQIVHPNFFSWSKVKSLFWRGLGEAHDTDVHLLDVSYRNSDAVTGAANGVLRLKHARFGSIDRESNLLMRPLAGVEGSVTAFASGSAAVKELDEKTRRSTKVAVVVLRDEDKEEARRQLRTPLVFSVHEAKGLEYETVIIYRLVSAERRLFAELCEGVQAEDLAEGPLEYRRAKDKSDRSLELYKFFVNALYVALTRAVRQVILVEDDLGHPLLALLGVGRPPSAAEVAAEKSSAEDWQREAHRLEAQGKAEQADAIRAQVLQLRPVPWPVFDDKNLRALADKALSPGSVSSKAKQQLFELACFHEECLVAERLVTEARFEPARHYQEQRARVARRALDGFEGKNFKEVLARTEQYGVDYRTPQGTTPLMLAAFAGNVALVEALLGRGASLEARDHCGRAALHWALRRAYRDPAYATTVFGTVFDLVAPASFDVEASGRLLQIGREMGEFFFFSTLVACFDDLYTSRKERTSGLTSDFFMRKPFRDFPEVVVKPARKRRVYVNGLLARNEPGSAYAPNRQLWIREARGHYVPNPALRLRIAGADGADAWVPLHAVMNLSWHESHLERSARWRLVRAAPAIGAAV
jgi:hypothetical protein